MYMGILYGAAEAQGRLVLELVAAMGVAKERVWLTNQSWLHMWGSRVSMCYPELACSHIRAGMLPNLPLLITSCCTGGRG